MMLKQLSLTPFKRSVMVAFLLSGVATNVYADELLTGDTRLACEAILCLSSGTQPSECNPSLTKYFSIWDKRIDRMIQKRINFLNLCPASNEPNMPTLINAIGHGAGRCDAEFLNAHNTFTYEEQECTKYGWRSDDETCHTVQKTGISNDLPKYCGTYTNHEWTYQLDVKYVGTPTTGGKWVSHQDYQSELDKYNQRMAELAKTNSGRQQLQQSKTIEHKQMFSNDR